MSHSPSAGRWLRPALSFVLVAALLYFLLRTVQPTRFVSAARLFHPAYLAPLVASYVVYLGFRALRWHLLVRTIRDAFLAAGWTGRQ
jgi:uncharacterized membrane protein YbhN (UPF0104 family)